MSGGLITAFRTLTAIPVPGRDADKMVSALPWFPVAGLSLGLILYGIADLFGRLAGPGWPEGCAAILVVAAILLTRGIHLDGLADWADGFWGARDREKTLAIMKDPRVGSFGVLAIASVLLLKWVCFSRLIGAGELKWIIAAYVVSRTMQAALLATHPYARPGGGTAAPFAQGADWRHLSMAMAGSVVLIPLICGLRWQWFAVILAGWAVTRLFGLWCRRRLGGITGDLIGACSEIVESTVLLAGGMTV